jgi:hypothetical protein
VNDDGENDKYENPLWHCSSYFFLNADDADYCFEIKPAAAVAARRRTRPNTLSDPILSRPQTRLRARSSKSE